MKINKTLVAALIMIIGTKKYLRFTKFIDSLQLGLEVLEIKNGFAIVAIKNMNYLNIPYKIKSIDLIIDKVTWAATNKQSNANLFIVPKSQTPLLFFKALSDNFTEEELQKSDITITYNFYGFEFKRLYKPVSGNLEIGNNNDGQGGSFCGCGGHKNK